MVMRQIICPYCELNLELKEGYCFCKYCGKPLMNKCTNFHCGRTLSNDVVFCPYCGSESKFKIKGKVTPPPVSHSEGEDDHLNVEQLFPSTKPGTPKKDIDLVFQKNAKNLSKKPDFIEVK